MTDDKTKQAIVKHAFEKWAEKRWFQILFALFCIYLMAAPIAGPIVYNEINKKNTQVAVVEGIEEQKRDEALKELQTNLAKSPYFYSMNQILKFQDQNGRLLYGRYSDEELKQLLQTLTTDGAENELPKLLVFKVESGTRYYVYKAKVNIDDAKLSELMDNETFMTAKECIDYGFAEADTTYGKVGVKVWIYKGEVLPTKATKEGSDK